MSAASGRERISAQGDRTGTVVVSGELRLKSGISDIPVWAPCVQARPHGREKRRGSGGVPSGDRPPLVRDDNGARAPNCPERFPVSVVTAGRGQQRHGEPGRGLRSAQRRGVPTVPPLRPGVVTADRTPASGAEPSPSEPEPSRLEPNPHRASPNSRRAVARAGALHWAHASSSRSSAAP